MTEHVAVYIEFYHFVFTIFTISITQLRQGRKYVYKKQTLCLFIRKTCVIQSNISYAFYHIFGIPYLLRNNFKLSWNFALGFWSLLLECLELCSWFYVFFS